MKTENNKDLFFPGKMYEYYIEWFNTTNGKTCKNNFTGQTAFEDALSWGKKNLENFNLEMVRLLK